MQFSARFSVRAHAERNGPDPRWVVHVGILAGLASRCQCSYATLWGAAEPDGTLGRLLTPAEAADIIHVSTSTLLRWARLGQLPSITIPSGRRRFRLTDLPGFTGPQQAADGASPPSQSTE